MAHIIDRSRSAGAAMPLQRVFAAAGRGFLAFARGWESRRAMRDLGAFDERMLADIGLNRSDLRDALTGHPWSDATLLLTNRRRERKLARARAAASVRDEIFDAPSLVPHGSDGYEGAERRDGTRRCEPPMT